MPTTKQRISINLSDSEHTELAALAKKHNISMAWIGHQALLEFLERQRERESSPQLPLTFTQREERPKWPTHEGPQ
jgi:hypothetical protein